jgi:hypothetical protein
MRTIAACAGFGVPLDGRDSIRISDPAISTGHQNGR